MDKDIFNQLLLIIIPVLTAAAALAVAWLRAKTREINRKAEEDEAKNNLELLDKVVLDVAKTLSQTLVEELEKAHPDGRLSFEDMERVKLEALEHTYSILDESIVLMLKKTTNDLDCLICSKIESNLCKLKRCNGD
jgi:flagellar basal body-associated protein FliL